MSKFKIGDKVRITKRGTHRYKIGAVVELIGFHRTNLHQKWETAGEKGWLYDHEFEEIPEPSPKTYTLTPYIKPETIMLHGVEYLVTENV